MDLNSFLDLDDDLFCEARSKVPAKGKAEYHAKVTAPQWFEKVPTTDETEAMQLHKYTADFAFRCCEYNKALQHYTKTLERLVPTNLTMIRDVQESICRCHLRLDNATDAILPARKLVESAQNFDQKTTSLNLLAEVYKATSCLNSERLTLMKSIWLHPKNCDAWLRLSYIFLALYENASTVCNRGLSTEHSLCSATEDLLIDGNQLNDPSPRSSCKEDAGPQIPSSRMIIGICLLRTKILASHVGHLPPFVKQRYRQIRSCVEEKLADLEYDDDFLNKRKVMLGADISSDRNLDTFTENLPVNIPETELIKIVDSEEFTSLFHKRWFPEKMQHEQEL